jgi:pimeloyl-ACP methyl ester carboxylesterase
MFDEGTGTPLVIVQPLQGRWEWTRDLLHDLSRSFRVISYSLSGDLGSGQRMDQKAGFDGFVRQLEDVIDSAGITGRAAVCGISFGGAVAARYAARHPNRVSRLIVASSPGPGWKPNSVQAGYVARPWLSLPAFGINALNRAAREVAAALPARPQRLWFFVRYGALALRFPAMPHLMARRVRLMEELDLAADCTRISAPTLVITGEPALDLVVPVDSTKRYAELIRNSRVELMDRTGHLGVLTQPDRFARIVKDFVNASDS